MAKDITGNPMVFDAVGQKEGQALFNPTDDNFNTSFYVQLIKFINPSTASNTEFEVVEGSTDADTLTGAIQVAAGDEQDVWLGRRVDGVYIKTLPTSGKVLVLHGYP